MREIDRTADSLDGKATMEAVRPMHCVQVLASSTTEVSRCADDPNRHAVFTPSPTSFGRRRSNPITLFLGTSCVVPLFSGRFFPRSVVGGSVGGGVIFISEQKMIYSSR